MPATSRIGRKISRRACDFCRDRRVQCTFEEADSTSCRQCLKSRAPCTFLTQRKPRGPRRSRYEPAVINAAFALTKINNNDDDSSYDGKSKNNAPYLKDDAAANSDGRASNTPSAGSTPASISAASGPAGPAKMTTTTTTTTTTTGAIGKAITTGPAPLPVGIPSVEHLVPEAVLRIILDEYVNRVYPVIPLVHLPTFSSRLHAREFATDPVFFRLCMAICAVTVASIPRNGGTYGAPWYRSNNVAEMVDRAAHLVMLSHMSSSPGWQNAATVDGILVNVLLALAFHYSGRQNAGWTYSSNAMLAFRRLELYKKESYAEMSTVDAEMSKRAFWLMFIMQIHDRMSYVYPHMGLNYDPKHTDWEFLLPLDVEDEALISPLPGIGVSKSVSGNSLFDPVAGNRKATTSNSSTDGSAKGCSPLPPPPPTISGFIGLVKVFLCVADLLDAVFPGPPAHFSLSPGSQTLQSILPEREAGLFKSSITPSTLSSYSYSFFFPQTQSPGSRNASPSLPDQALKQQPRSDVNVLDSLFQVMARLDTVLSTLPDELRPIRTPEDARRAAMRRHHIPPQFEIMRANVQITSIYIQSMIIEMCLGRLQCLSGQTEVHAISSAQYPPPNANSIPQVPKQETSQFFQEWAERARRIDLVDWSDRERTAASQQQANTSPAAKAAANELRSRLWQLKGNVARELLEAITSVPTWVLESNGSSMIYKIREIAATLLDDGASVPLASVSKGNTNGYLGQFVQILADLDHVSRGKI